MNLIEAGIRERIELLYIAIGSTNDVTKYEPLIDEVHTIENLIDENDPINYTGSLEYNCNGDHCWECACKEDPMDI